MEVVYKFTNNGLYPIKYQYRKHVKKDIENPESSDYNPYQVIVNDKRKKSLENLNVGYETKGVSDVTRKKIALACRVLSYSANVVKTRNSKGEYINHLCMFITLTLPSTQKHQDKEITKIILGTFLDKCRKIDLLNNYVWRAEKQKNGNIHYHIVTDSFCNYNLIRRLWYISLEKLGYMTDYREKFQNMNYEVYRSQDFNKNVSLDKINARYAKGVRNNWSEPPCVDTELIQDISGISKYISKYVGKKNDDNINIVTGRVWSCSTSVSEAVKVFKTDDEFNRFWYNYSTQVLKKKELKFDYFSLCLCKFQSIISWVKGVYEYIKKELLAVLTPCNYYKKSLGIT